MGPTKPSTVDWLSSAENPAVRYLTARDLLPPRASPEVLAHLRTDMLTWEPLQQVLELQLEDGSFPYRQKTPTAQPTFTALCLMQRCGMDVGDEPVARTITYLAEHHMGKSALSYTSGGSGVLPCYLGVVCTALIKMGALDTDLVQSSLAWLMRHQRFDHKQARAGGGEQWPYRAPVNYGCWEGVSCYHGVAGAFRALAAVPPERRSADVRQRLDEALDYLRVHWLYKRSTGDKPIVRHLTRFFLVGDYRCSLLDMLEGVADADPSLVGQEWVRVAVEDMDALAEGGRVVLRQDYGRRLMDPIPLEQVGEPSRFLTYQWARVRVALGLDPWA